MSSVQPTKKKTPTQRIAVHGSIKNVIESAWTSITRPFRTAATLLSKPGRVYHEYVDGFRESVSNPAIFAFLGATSYIALNYFTTSEVGRFFDPLSAARHLWPYLGIALLAPVMALQRAMFKRAKYNYAETMAFGMFVLGELGFANALMRGFLYAANIKPTLPLALALLMPQAAYTAWCVTQFYGDTRRRTWLRGAAVFAAYAALSAGILYGLSWLAFHDIFKPH